MKTAEEIIRDANRISEFLRDPVIADALSGLERRYYEEFIAAPGGEQRANAQAKARLLRDFEAELNKINSAAEMEILKAAKSSAKS